MGKKRRKKKDNAKSKRTPWTTGTPLNLAEALDQADRYARRGRESEILTLLTPLEKDYPFEDPRQSETYDRLLAFGLSYAGDLPRAEKIVERAIRTHRPSRDVYFSQAFVKLSMREYAQTVEACRKYLEIDNESERRPETQTEVTAPPTYASQIYNFMGAAYGQLNQPDQATEAFRTAIEREPSNHLPYLNLAGMYRNLDQREQAAAVVEDGLKKCRRVDELRMLQESLKHRERISACLMVKNEEELLPGCLDSIRDWVDEIIVLDTGSTDRTVAIAEEYGARIFHQPWENNFSKHRNYSIDQATGDWIFIIDADERIVGEDVPQILGAVNDGKFRMLSINVLNVYGKHQDRTTFVNSVRFFRRDMELRYDGVVHNALILPEDEPALRTRIRLTHLGYDLSAERMKEKFELTQDLLKQQLEADPDNTFALFNYAELLRGVNPVISREHADEIIQTAGRVIELTQPDDRQKRHLHLMCLCQLAAVYIHQKQFDKALEYCERALAARPDYFDALIFAGFSYHGLQEYDRAIERFERYLTVQEGFDGTSEEDPVIMSYPHSRDLASNNLGVLYQLTGNPRRAAEHYRETLKINPNYGEAASLLGRLHLSEGDVEKAEQYFLHQLENSIATIDALIGLAKIAEDRGEGEEAGQFLERAVNSFPDNQKVYLEQGAFLAGRGEEQDAIKAFERGLGLGGSDDRSEFSIARICFENKLWSAAAGFYDCALTNHGESSELLNDLGNCYYKLNDLVIAEQFYVRAVALTPPSPLAYRNLGLVQSRLGKPNQAISALESYLEVNPDECAIRLLVADLCRQIEEFGQSIPHYERILTAQPENQAALLGLSESYRLMGHEDTALLGFRRLLQLDPECQPAQERVRELASHVPQT